MPFILGILALAAAAYFWTIRARNAAAATNDLIDVANEIRLAARRFGFKRQSNLHPVESIEDPRIAVAAIGVSFLELDSYPAAEQRDVLTISVREQLQITHEEAEELVILGRWMMTESGGGATAVPRLSRKLYKLSGQDYFTPLMNVLNTVAKFGNDELSSAQKSALEDIRLGLKIS